MSEAPTTLSACLYTAKGAAKLAAAWAEVVDQFPHHAAVAHRFAREAEQTAKIAKQAAETAASLAPTPERAKSEKAQHALADAQRVREYADLAAQAATHATASAHAARRFKSTQGDLADLCRARQQAVFAWLSCPEGELVKLAVLRARVEEAEAAVQAALPVPATA